MALGGGFLALVVGAATFLIAPKLAASDGIQTMQYVTSPVAVEGIYPSMIGPDNTDVNVKLKRDGPAELLWITGYRANMIDAKDSKPLSSQFMCHNTLSIHDSLQAHAKTLGSGTFRSRRLFTLSQGQERLNFPPGFGIPVASTERFMLQSQVLNLQEAGVGAQVRHKVETQFVSDADAQQPMKALSLVEFGIALEVADQQARHVPDDACAQDAGGQGTFRRADGREMTAHWIVKPGVDTRTTDLGRHFKFNTTVHYISAHLHGFAESLELRDVTANKTVFKVLCKPTADGEGLAEVGHYSSVEGTPVFAQHSYQLISRYNNTSRKDKTAMAFMFCYIADPYFERPTAEQVAARSGNKLP